MFNPSNAEATFIQSTRTQKFQKTIWTLLCGYSLESSCWALSYEYPFARFSVIFQFFLHHFVLAKLATSSIRVNQDLSSLSFGQAVSWEPPFSTGRNFYEEFLYFYFIGQIALSFLNKPSPKTWLKCKLPFLSKRLFFACPDGCVVLDVATDCMLAVSHHSLCLNIR